VKSSRKSERGRRTSFILVEDSQASSARRSDKSVVKTKTLGWLETVA
jgi:hypothetical protein